ncbi:MAG: penicillin-binding protein 2 [Planctomycetota bacterium]
MGINHQQRQKISRIVAILLFGGYTLVVSRLLHVQVTKAETFAGLQDSMLVRQRHKIGSSQFERGTRGRILDADGVQLALGFDTYRLIVDPAMPRRAGSATLKDRLRVALRAVESIGIEVDSVRFFERGGQTHVDQVRPNGFIESRRVRRRVLLSGLLPYQRDYLQEIFQRRNQRFRDFSFEAESEREYPQGSLCAEVIGFVGRSGADIENRPRGRAGIEFVLDELLSGEHGEFDCEKDGLGREFDQNGRWIKAPKDGYDVGLSLSVGIQTIADEEIRKVYQEFDCQAVTAIVMETQTGRILALRSYPTFAVEDVRANRVHIRDTVCRAVANTYPPGSVFKPFIAAWALDRGLVSWDDVFDVSAGIARFEWQGKGRRVRDSHPNGVLDLRGVIRVSSNMAMAQIGHERLGFGGVYDAVEGFEFGRRTGVLLPHEPRPLFASRAAANPLYFSTSVSFGQEISLTPLQIASKFAVFGTGGIYCEPSLVDWIGKGSDRRANTRSRRRLISAKVADEMKTVLIDVVENGTAKPLKDLPWQVAAKTGTAELFDKNGNMMGYSSSICALAPAADPMITVWVGLHELNGTRIYATSTAGPAVRAIIERTLTKLGVPAEVGREEEE